MVSSSKQPALAFLLLTSVPHPFRFFLRKGWEAYGIQVCTMSNDALIDDHGEGDGSRRARWCG